MAVNGKVMDVFNRVARGETPGPSSSVRVQRRTFYHRRDMANTTDELIFFNGSPETHLTNLASSGLDQDAPFLLTSIRAVVEFGYDQAGSAVSAVAGYALSGGGPMAVAEDLRTIYQAGEFVLSSGDQTIANVFGIGRLIGGAAADIDVAMENDGATTPLLASAVNVLPGGADCGGYAMTPWVPILPGRPIKGSIKFNHTRSLTGAYVLRLELDGIQVSPANQ